MFITNEVAKNDQRNILKNTFLILSHFLTHEVIGPLFCRFSVIFDFLTIQALSLDFLVMFILRKSCSAWLEIYFEKIIFFISCLVFDVLCHAGVILPFLSNFWLNFFVSHLNFIFKRCLSWYKVVQHDQRYVLNLFVISCPASYVWRHIVVILPFFNNITA